MMTLDVAEILTTGLAGGSLWKKIGQKIGERSAKKAAKVAAKEAAKKAAVPILTKVGIVIGGTAYWICLTIALGGIIAYMIGYKKGLRATAASLIVYIFIEAIV